MIKPILVRASSTNGSCLFSIWQLHLLDNFNASVNTKLDKLCFKVVPNDLSIFRVSILAIVLSC